VTREQVRASLVYEVVKRYEGTGEAKEYGSMALRFPALLRTAGLVQALAFVYSRGSDAHKKFVRDLAEVLLKLEDERSKLEGEAAYNEYFENVRKAKLPQYLSMTREALAVADWFKRFAQSVLKAEFE